MKFFGIAAALFILIAPVGSIAQSGGGLDRAEAIGPFLNGALPSKSPRPSTGSWRLVNAFPGLTFIDPVQMLPVPFSNRLLVLEKAGRLVVFDNRETVASKTVLMDLRSKVESSHDSGMVGVAFHPEFASPDSPNRHFLYVYYRYTPQKTDTNRAYCRLSRFTWDPATDSIAPSSESILINQYDRHNWHNGGGLFFGLDGFLYLSVGDEGGANDQYNTGQRMDAGLLAGVLRIDVDRDPTRSHPIRRQPRNPTTPPSGWPNSYSQGYYIPNDNPWQSPDGSRLEEFYAVGLRSPHRMTQDPVTGDIWVGDVGQGTQEEVSKIVKGGNYQWPYREGNATGPKAKPANLIGFDVPPVHAYGRSTGGCVIGGYVYRGALHPELQGKYLFGDHNTGRIWSLDPSGASPAVASLLTLQSHGPGPKRGMASFGLDAVGEIHVLSLAGTDLDGGRIYRLEKSTEGVPEPPRLLSQTTAFSNLAELTPSPGLIPYDVIQPLWSDGSDKRRWIAIPNDGSPDSPGERIGWSEQGNWDFPKGTVLVKHFEVPGRRLETRFFLLGEDGIWFGFTYRWREDGSDAELLPEAPLDETYTVNGTTRTWHYPGRNECASCHTDAAGKALGLKTHQLNRDFHYASTGRSANQLVTLNRLGFFSPAIDESRLATVLTARNQNDPDATLERRARSYLDANCSHCHQPAAPTQAAFDARLGTPPWHQNLINVLPGNDLGIPGALLVAPGHIELSALHHRVASTAPGAAMPPIAKGLVDEEGLELLADWIASLDPAIGPTGPAAGTPPQDHSAPVLTLSKPGESPEVEGAFTATLTASEPILGLSADDFVVVNGTVSDLNGSGAHWTFTVTPAGVGEGSVAIPSDRVADARGNANPAVAVPLRFDFRLPVDPDNLLSNGGFESQLDDWHHGPSVEAAATAYRGLSSVSVGASTWLVRTIPVEELADYVYSGWTASSAPGVHAEAGLTFWDANGVWIHDRIAPLAPGTDWERFELAFTAPVAARSVSVWILSDASGGLFADELSVVPGGDGEERPAYRPDLSNRIGDGGFESGIAPWDAGGPVSISPAAYRGGQAVRLGLDGFIVQTLPATPGERLALAGHYFTGGTGRLELGFSFWGGDGVWITDRTLVLEETSGYAPFLVDTSVPEDATTLTVWAWRATGGEATLDELVLFGPDEAAPPIGNLLTNGGFENGGVAPWDTGGTDVRLVAGARSGANAARLASDAFLVHNRAAGEGRLFTLSGHYRTEGGTPGAREAGFSFWSATGAWLGDAIAALAPTGDYLAFSVEGTAPAGAASLSAWIWTGGDGGGLIVDDIVLAEAASPASALTDSPETSADEIEIGASMAQMSLKSGRTLDLGDASSDALLAEAFGDAERVVASGWTADAARTVRSTGPGGRRKTLAAAIEGPGIVSARWSLDAAPGGGTLKLLVDGRTRAVSRGSAGWQTVAATLSAAGAHTVEFRFEPGPGAGSAALDDFRFLPGSPVLQPDLAIGTRPKRLVGLGIHNRSAMRQSAWATARRRAVAKFHLQWRNAAPAVRDGARLIGPAGNRTNRTAYFRTSPSRSNATAAIALGRHETSALSPRAAETYQMRVHAAGRTKKRGRFAGFLRAHSLLDPARTDAVRVQTLPK